jgi:hypothetical protein
MKIDEFFRKYHFHDSLITGVEPDLSANVVILTISFCNWMQDDYTPDQPETIDLKLRFNNVERF